MLLLSRPFHFLPTLPNLESRLRRWCSAGLLFHRKAWRCRYTRCLCLCKLPRRKPRRVDTLQDLSLPWVARTQPGFGAPPCSNCRCGRLGMAAAQFSSKPFLVFPHYVLLSQGRRLANLRAKNFVCSP